MTKNDAKKLAAKMEADRLAREAARRANEIAAMKAAGVKSAAEREAEEAVEAPKREAAITASFAFAVNCMNKLDAADLAEIQARYARTGKSCENDGWAIVKNDSFKVRGRR